MKELVLSPEAGESSFKGEVLRRHRAVKTGHIQGLSQLQRHSSSSRAGLQPRSRTLSHSALGGVSTGVMSLWTFLPLGFLWLLWGKHYIITITWIAKKNSIPYLREFSKYKLNVTPHHQCARVCIRVCLCVHLSICVVWSNGTAFLCCLFWSNVNIFSLNVIMFGKYMFSWQCMCSFCNGNSWNTHITWDDMCRSHKIWLWKIRQCKLISINIQQYMLWFLKTIGQVI